MSREIRERCLSQLRASIGTAMALAEGPGAERSLGEMSRTLPGGVSALQDGDDLMALVQEEAARLFSPQTGEALRRELERRFLALTANHHGMDFHPEFLQGDLVFALGCREAVPLFAFGGVPCDNVAFPRGMLVSSRTPESTKPFHLPVFSNAGRRAFVSAAGPFDAAALKKAAASFSSLPLSEAERAAAKDVVAGVYGDGRVLAQPSFRDQMSVAGALLWRRLAAPGFSLPPLVPLDIQFLAGRLVQRDVTRPGTLVRSLLLEPELTRAVFRALDGARACWAHGKEAMKGTFLFWSVNEKRRGVGLTLSQDGRSLVPVERGGSVLPLTAEAVTQALSEGRVLPSLYLCFAALALARGLSCAGGVFQCEYLPRMAQGTAEALRLCGETALAERLAVSSPLVTGTLPLRAAFPPSAGRGAADAAAGALDVMAAGGLGEADWQALASLSFHEAFFCALSYHYEDLTPPERRIEGWMEALSGPAPLLLRRASANKTTGKDEVHALHLP